MKNWKLSDLSQKMKNLDICMLSTHASRESLNARPMSNNGDVEYDGNSYFFTSEDSSLVKEIGHNAQVSLSFSGPKHLYITVIGKAKLVKSKEIMKEHWLDELKRWFDKGLDTPGIVMLHVEAARVRYWEGEEQGEIAV